MVRLGGLPTRLDKLFGIKSIEALREAVAPLSGTPP